MRAQDGATGHPYPRRGVTARSSKDRERCQDLDRTFDVFPCVNCGSTESGVMNAWTKTVSPGLRRYRRDTYRMQAQDTTPNGSITTHVCKTYAAAWREKPADHPVARTVGQSFEVRRGILCAQCGHNCAGACTGSDRPASQMDHGVRTR